MRKEASRGPGNGNLNEKCLVISGEVQKEIELPAGEMPGEEPALHYWIFRW